MKGTRIPTKKSPVYYSPDRFRMRDIEKLGKSVIFVAQGKFTTIPGQKLIEVKRLETNKFIKIFLNQQP